MRTPVLTLAAAAITAALLSAGPAYADPSDDSSFLNALGNAGVGVNNPADSVALGQSICPMLVEPGKDFASVASTLRGDNGISPGMASMFTGLAIQAYCPSMMSSIADGTIVNQLGGLSQLGGTGGFQIPGM